MRHSSNGDAVLPAGPDHLFDEIRLVEQQEEVSAIFSDETTEIIPPENDREQPDGRICLCCRRARRWMDGRGVCEECLEP